MVGIGNRDLVACTRAGSPAEVAAHEVRAAAVARPAVGIRALPAGPAQVSIIGNACPAAISAYLARLYPRERDRVRLVIARLGADPALLEPTPIPVLQAAQLLGVPPSACAVVASTPAEIRGARLAGACAIGYACDPATRQRLTAAGAEAATASIAWLASMAYLAAVLTAARRSATPDTGHRNLPRSCCELRPDQAVRRQVLSHRGHPESRADRRL
jgi:phosphoglycolate phosphatase